LSELTDNDFTDRLSSIALRNYTPT